MRNFNCYQIVQQLKCQLTFFFAQLPRNLNFNTKNALVEKSENRQGRRI